MTTSGTVFLVMRYAHDGGDCVGVFTDEAAADAFAAAMNGPEDRSGWSGDRYRVKPFDLNPPCPTSGQYSCCLTRRGDRVVLGHYGYTPRLEENNPLRREIFRPASGLDGLMAVGIGASREEAHADALRLLGVAP